MSNIVIGNKAIKGMVKGMKTAIDAVRLSYGPKGLNASIEHNLYPYHQVANDCETIIQAIELDNPVHKMGLSFLKELSSKAHKDSGDGRKTTLLIADKILELGIKSKLSGMALKRELDNLIPFIEKKINEQKKNIDESQIKSVATIAGESEFIGSILQEIYQKIGKEGIIIPEGSNTYATSYSIIEGVRFTNTGYLSPYLVHDEVAEKEGRQQKKAVYENPVILVTKNKISKDSDIESIVDECIKVNRPLVIFTDDMDSGVAQRIIATHIKKVAKILIIKAPVLFKQYVFEDFAKITGATIIEDSSGVNFKDLEWKHLGNCGKITVDKDETIVLGGKDISEHIQNLKSNDDTDSKLRLSWLQTKTCILKLGANNESELSYLRLKCHDAINSSLLALKDGVVKGGGVCLRDVSKEMPETIAGIILKEALESPYIQNCENMDIEPDDIADFGENVIDSSVVVKNAVRNAISLASTVLTAGRIVITLPPQNKIEDKSFKF